MQTPLISVIVPMYKVERYIKICIDSILAQTFQDFEIIIVDDASPDNCYEICQKLYGSNDKVRIIRHAVNQGLGPARNTGIENARGKYIYFVDSDDVIVPNALEILYNTAEKTGADVVHTSAYYETDQDDDKTFDVSQFRLVKEPINSEGFISEDRIYRWEKYFARWNEEDAIRGMAVLDFCRCDIFKNYQLRFEEIVSEDELFNFEVLAYVEKFFVLRKALYVYRQREGSIMKSYNLERLSKGILSIYVVIYKMKSVMALFPKLRGETNFQEYLINRLIKSLLHNHIEPFYEKDVMLDVEVVVTEILKEIFGANTTFVKYFFHKANALQVQINNLNAQAGQLFGAYQQLAQRQQRMDLFLTKQAAALKLFEEIKKDTDKIFIIGAVCHGNIGDHAIIEAEYFVLENLFPNRKIIEIPSPFPNKELFEIFLMLDLQKYIKPSDIIVMNGGGDLGNLWIDEEIFRCSVVERFHNNKFIIFPQSVYFTDDKEGKNRIVESAKVYSAHPDLHLMLRDENSFNLANKIFPNVHTYLMPDVVTTLYGIMDNVNIEREGVLFVLRSDKEKVRDDSTIAIIQEFLTAQNIPFSLTDSNIGENIYKANRKEKVYELLTKFRQSRLVITDRFHGVIFSYITKTPVMAFKSFDTKISSGIKWFKNLPSIYYAENANFDDMKNFILQAYNKNLPAETSPDFMSKFAETLQKITADMSKLKTSDLNLKRGGVEPEYSLPYRIQYEGKERVKKLILLAVPMSICNFRCHYCYLSQRPESYQGVQPEMKYSPEQVAKALSKKRLGGLAYMNVCADGETLLLKDVDIYMKRLVEEGHYVEFVTNCTITNVLKKFLSWDKELLAHIEFKCSFHYLELKKKNLLEVFARNVNDIWAAGASANVEMTPNDELIPYIDEIKEFSLKNFGALPHITIARDDRTKGIDILSKLPEDEYYKIWGQFDSTMFDYKKTIFGKRQEEFCYAGIWSAHINLATGMAKGCYCGRSLGDVFANPESDFPTFPVAKCTLAHCYNAHALMTWGNIPHATKVNFADIRNRVRSDGKEWLQPKLKSFFSTQLCESNEELSDVEKFNFLVRNMLDL